MHYVIATPGRTGSLFLCSMLGGSGHSEFPGQICNAYRIENEITLEEFEHHTSKHNGNTVIHSHDMNPVAKYKLNPKNVTLIISKRNLWELIMSNTVASITNEAANYTNKPIVPEHVTLFHFKMNLLKIKSWYENLIIPGNCNQILTIQHECVINNGPKYVADLLGIKDFSYDPSLLTMVNPYRYQDWILNWKELYTFYLGMEGNYDTIS